MDTSKFIVTCIESCGMSAINDGVDIQFRISSSEIPALLDTTRRFNLVPESILRHLRRKYKPNQIGEGYHFEGPCIEYADANTVLFKRSEPHKVFTDLNYLTECLEFGEEVNIMVQSLRLTPADRVLYYLYFKKYYPEHCNPNHLPTSKIYTYEEILWAKLRAFRRKWLRIYILTGHLTILEFNNLLNVKTPQINQAKVQSLMEKYPLPNISTLL